LTLPPSLLYQYDTASSPPTIDGQDIVWSLGEASPWSHGAFEVTVVISSTATLMQTFPLTATITVEGQEATLANNSDSAVVVIKRPLYLPWVLGPG
jgi:hypothetical protein